MSGPPRRSSHLAPLLILLVIPIAAAILLWPHKHGLNPPPIPGRAAVVAPKGDHLPCFRHPTDLTRFLLAVEDHDAPVERQALLEDDLIFLFPGERVRGLTTGFALVQLSIEDGPDLGTRCWVPSYLEVFAPSAPGR